MHSIKFWIYTIKQLYKFIRSGLWVGCVIPLYKIITRVNYAKMNYLFMTVLSHIIPVCVKGFLRLSHSHNVVRNALGNAFVLSILLDFYGQNST
jgi:hypothetical protein